MLKELSWDDLEGIAVRLLETQPDTDPLSVRFTDLHRWIVALPEFQDDPKLSNEAKLEAVQMAWYEEWQDRNG